MQRVNWDDFRFVLAVAETGSVGAAARALGVNHATVLRRISAFEDAQQIEIFARSPQGYAVHPEHLRIVEALREAARAIEGVGRTIRGAGERLTGLLRVTSTDTLCIAVLPGIVARLNEQSPDLQIDLRAANVVLDLGRLDADLTVRPALRLPDTLVGVVAAQLGFAAYAARGRAEGPWLRMGGVLERSQPAKWLTETIPPEQSRGGADSFPVLRELAAEGLGTAILPCCLGDPDPRLDRLSTALPAMSVPIWVASHTDMSEVPRILLTRDRLVAALQAKANHLSGDLSG